MVKTSCLVITLSLLAGVNAHADQDVILGFDRCGTLGDSLSIEQGAGRRAWASKNYSSNPVWRVYYSLANNYVDLRPGVKPPRKLELYPTYGVFSGGTSPEGFPNVANPRAYQGGIKETDPANLPQDYTLIALCVPSCFAPGTQIQVSDVASESVETLKEKKVQSLLTLSNQASLGSLGKSGSYQQSQVERYISDLPVDNPAPQDLVDLEFKSGGRLLITPEHAVLTPAGNMKPAKYVVLGDLFVKADGSLDEVTRVATTRQALRVYNMMMVSQEPLENVVISNGYLTGTYYFQNMRVELLNRQIFRDSLPEHLGAS